MVPIGLKVMLMRFFSILGLSRQRLYVGNLIPYGKLIGCAMDSTIRHYQPSDQTALFELSADTAFFGEPVEAFLEDRRLYSDAFVRYYLDYETAYVWVAEGLEGVTGFLLGCAHTAHQSRHWRGYILTRVLLKALSGQYHLGRRTASFAFGMWAGLMRGEEPTVDLSVYPAHLQIDVKQSYRGQGVGSRLINAYLEQLRQMDVCGVHLQTTSHNTAAYHLYEKMGFSLLDNRPNRYWTRRFGFEIENRSYGSGLK